MVNRNAFSVILSVLAISLLLGASGCSSDGASTDTNASNASNVSTQNEIDNLSYSGSTSNTAVVSWMPPTERTDGSVLTDLAGYRVYYGQSLNAMSNIIDVQNPGQTSQFIDNLETGTWYFAVTAFTADGLESGMSELAAKTIL